MSSKTKSLTELITELEQENKSLQSLKKLFNQACREEFGYDVKGLHAVIRKAEYYSNRVPIKQGQQVANEQSD